MVAIEKLNVDGTHQIELPPSPPLVARLKFTVDETYQIELISLVAKLGKGGNVSHEPVTIMFLCSGPEKER